MNEDIIFGALKNDTEDKKIEDKKIDEEKIKDKANQLTNILQSFESPEGSGDVLKDMVDWMSGNSNLPSSELSAFTSNFRDKAKLGMYMLVLNTLTTMPKMLEYRATAESILFDTKTLVADYENGDYDPEELMKNWDKANSSTIKMLDSLRRILIAINDLDTEEREDMEKMRILLASMPKERIKGLLENLK